MHTRPVTTAAPMASLIALGARNLSTLRDFYQALGWPQIVDDSEFVAFELRGIVLALFRWTRSDGSDNAVLAAAPRAAGL